MQASRGKWRYGADSSTEELFYWNNWADQGHYARTWAGVARAGSDGAPMMLRCLPTDVLTRVLEFLPFKEVHTAAKRVSRQVRKAARRALTRPRGRWQDVKAVAAWRRDVPSFTPALCETFRAAWKLEPAEVLHLCLTTTTDPAAADIAARFLAIVEPSLDGFGHIVKHCEPAHRIHYALRKLQNTLPDASAIDYHGCGYLARHIIVAWVDKVEGWDNIFQHNFALERFSWDITKAMQHSLAEALEYWESPALAADFMYPDWAPDWVNEDDTVSFIGPSGGESTAYALSVSWYDRRKAAALVTCAKREDEERSRLNEEAAGYDPRVFEPDLPSIGEQEAAFKAAVAEVEQELRLEPAPVSDREIGDCYAYMERVVKLGQCVGDSYDA